MSTAPAPAPAARSAVTRESREVHLGGLRQLTFGGENAEAYWSFDGTQLLYQARQQPNGKSYDCDQIFVMPASGGESRLVSTGKGRTTCSYFFPGNRRLLYASTHQAGDACPAAPDMSKGYVWPLYDSFDIFSARADGAELRPLTTSKGMTPRRRLRQGRLDRLHLDARRRPRALYDGCGRQECPALTNTPATTAARSSRPTASSSCGARRVRGSARSSTTTARARPGAGPPVQARALRRGCGRHRRAADHVPRRGLVRPVVLSRRKADRLLLELRRSQGA